MPIRLQMKNSEDDSDMKEQNILICSYDVLPNGTVKPSALQRYFQQIALEDIAACGATYSALRTHSMVFVLTKLRVDFTEPICSGETVLLRTHPYKVEGVTFFRAFELWKGERLIGSADSRWVLLNYEKRTIMRPSDLPFDIPTSVPSAEPLVIPRRISLNGVAETSQLRTVLLSEVDENHHLNNCCYSDYVIDYAPMNVCDHNIKTFCILFDHEAYLGDVLELQYQKNPDGFTAVAINKTTGKSCFQSVFTLDFS